MCSFKMVSSLSCIHHRKTSVVQAAYFDLFQNNLNIYGRILVQAAVFLRERLRRREKCGSPGWQRYLVLVLVVHEPQLRIGTSLLCAARPDNEVHRQLRRYRPRRKPC